MSREQTMTTTIRRGRSPRRTAAPAHDQITHTGLHLLCLSATLLAAIVFTLTEHDAADHHHSVWCTAEIILQILVTLTAAFVIRRRASHSVTDSALPVLLVMIVLLSLLCEPVQRLLFDVGKPFEILVMHSQCNLMLALAACGHRLSYQRLAMLIAMFLTIFCCSISNASFLLPLAAMFTLLSLAWLITAWWDGLRSRQLVTSARPRWRTAVLLLGIPGLLALAVGTGSNTAASALRGIMPGSGGTEHSDPFARGGVNDGDHLIAGENNITSFAPIEGAPFLDSDKPSLYDVFNDTFDPPPRRIQKQQRAIALPSELLMHVHQQMADAKKAGRQFDLTRGHPELKKKQTEDLNTHALMQVAGRTPLHLRMEAYDVFDGFTWYPVEDDAGTSRPDRPMRSEDIQHWLQLELAGRALEIHGPAESHGLRLLNLGGNALPLPAHTTELSIERVDRPDMYRVRDAGRVSLARDNIPEMTTVNVVSHVIDRQRLAASDSLTLVAWSGFPAAALPTGFEDVEELAQSITASQPRGWRQVEAVCSYVRNRYELDRDARLPDDVASPVHHFLFESGRGPEYMFAAATATLLRSAGYATRLVSGFYVHPDKYDQRLHHTPVHARDAHFWCEVFVGTNVWVTIDPSPGYIVEDAPPGLWESLVDFARVIGGWVVANRILLIVLALAAAFGVRFRVRLQDVSTTAAWKWLRVAGQRRSVLSLGRIVKRRLQAAGVPVSGGITFRRAAEALRDPELAVDLRRLGDLVNWAAYSVDDHPADGTSESLAEVLSLLQSRLSLQRLRESVTTQRTAASDSPEIRRPPRSGPSGQPKHLNRPFTTTS